MWELYSGNRPYDGLDAAAIAERIYHGGLRPAFPRSTPPAYAELASACWATDPAARPGAAEIVARLEALHAGVAGEIAETAAAAAAGAAARAAAGAATGAAAPAPPRAPCAPRPALAAAAAT
jgi:hypothetical protein